VKLSIVTPKPQTTRESIVGILNQPGSQLIFLDTPGWLKPNDTLQSFMKKSLLRSLYDDADVVVWLLDPHPLTEEQKDFGGTLLRANKPLIVAINKIDTTPKEISEEVQSSLPVGFEMIPFVRLAAKNGSGVPELVGLIKDRLPLSPPYFPTDQITDRWERFYVTELIRERLFERYKEEVPHASAVVIDEFREQEGRKDFIKAIIYVESEGQKKILIGEKGRAIKEVGEGARKEIENRLGRPVFLELTVKVQKNWRKDPQFIKSYLSL
jgi:GTP-binding protein Era